jgi:large subunit ribosomal protein L3
MRVKGRGPILIGKKCGMSRVFTPDGASIPVTVVHIEKHTVTQVKCTKGADGYSAVQVSMGSRRHVNKPSKGHFKEVVPGVDVQEFRIDEEDEQNYQVGQQLTVALFEGVKHLDVSGRTIGKGFAGVVKRHGFAMGDATHGNSKAHRKAGSIGQCQDPGRVFKGKKMAGHMGNVQVTVQYLELVQIDVDNSLLIIKGAIPGAKGGLVRLCKSIKKLGKVESA